MHRAPAVAALAAASPDRLLPELLPWLLVLLGLVALSAVAIYFVRRSLRTDDEAPEEGFTLHGLRQMHARGDLTDEEFARAKAALVERTRGATSENPGDAERRERADEPSAGDA